MVTLKCTISHMLFLWCSGSNCTSCDSTGNWPWLYVNLRRDDFLTSIV